MKITDTVDQVLKQKTFNKILPISPEQTVHEALCMMAEYDVGALMVMSGSQLIGILSERDYARKGILVGNHSRDTLVRDIMSSPVVSVTPRHTVDDCMNLMTEGHFRHLPVLDGDKVDRRHLHWRHGQVGHLRPGTRHPGARGLHHGRVPWIEAYVPQHQNTL